MRKILSYLIVALLLVTVASACSFKCGTGYIEVAKWEYHDGWEKESERSGSNTDVSGDAQSADWESDPAALKVVAKAGTDIKTFSGGTSGTIDAWEQCWKEKNKDSWHWSGFPLPHKVYDYRTVCVDKDLSAILLCGKMPSITSTPPTTGGVPEFSTLTLGAAIIVGTLGMLYLRKR
ncbi:hypothetical protein JW711_05615 [Candidatus Woesearchaeota archaeon]|nr:hypothetical protein [Candidatus Woesearchaeota archaeon]